MIPIGIFSLSSHSFTLSRLCGGITNEIQFGLTNFFLIVAAVIIGKGISKKTFCVYFRINLKLISRSAVCVIECYKSNQLSSKDLNSLRMLCAQSTREMYNFKWKTPLSNQFICRRCHFFSLLFATRIENQNPHSLLKLLFYCRIDTNLTFKKYKNVYESAKINMNVQFLDKIHLHTCYDG